MTTQDLDRKYEVELQQLESTVISPKTNVLEDEAGAIGQVATGYEGLGPLETVRTFKMATLFSAMAVMAAACDGYQVSYPSALL
jgi:hypothetical protein